MKFKSLKEVCAAANALMLNTEEELKALDPEIIIEITIAAEKYIFIQTDKYAQRLWGQNFRNTMVMWVYYNQWWGWLARYYRRTGLMQINMQTVFCTNYIKLLTVIIHELCHKKYSDHSMKFWTYYYECLKCVGLVKQNECMEDVLRIENNWHGRTTEKNKIGVEINRLADLCNTSNYSQASHNFDILRHHKVFTPKYYGNNSRYFSRKYNDLVTKICTKYDVDKGVIDVEKI